MTNVYEVRLAVLTQDRMKNTGKKYGRPAWDMDGEKLLVLANGDAQKAVAKAVRHLSGRKYTWDCTERGRVVNEVLKVKLISVTRECAIDVR